MLAGTFPFIEYSRMNGPSRPMKFSIIERSMYCPRPVRMRAKSAICAARAMPRAPAASAVTAHVFEETSRSG